MAENTDSNLNSTLPDSDDWNGAQEDVKRKTDPVEQELVEENLAEKKKESDAVDRTIPDKPN